MLPNSPSNVWYAHCCEFNIRTQDETITLTTFLGCVTGCISVTKECYQIGKKLHLLSRFSEDLFGYIPGISTTNHATKELRADV